MADLKPRVSVVIPTYNRAETVVRAVRSVLAQSFGDLEVIVVDDGSTDSTADVVRAVGDERVVLIRQDNRGVSAARNRGVSAARGELVAFLDSDDLWDLDKIEKQVALFDDPQVGWGYSNYRIRMSDGTPNPASAFDDGKPTRGQALAHFFVHRFPIQTSSLIARKKCLVEAGLFNESFTFAEDIDLYFRLAERFAVDYVDEVLATYVASTGRSVPRIERLGRWIAIRRRVLDDNPGLKEALTPDELLTSYYHFVLRYARLLLRAGRSAEARAAAREYLSFDPRSTKARAAVALSFTPRAIHSRV